MIQNIALAAATTRVLALPGMAGMAKKAHHCVPVCITNSPCVSWGAVYLSLSMLVSTPFVLDNKRGQARGSVGGGHVSNGYEWPGRPAGAHTGY